MNIWTVPERQQLRKTLRAGAEREVRSPAYDGERARFGRPLGYR